MTAAVFDTNVVVSAMLTPDGTPGKLLDAILDGLCQPVVTDSILSEYETVLCRPTFGFPTPKVCLLLDALRSRAQYAPFASVMCTAGLPDPDDVIFLEAALSLAVPIVTGNLKHFPQRAVGHIQVLSPATFLVRLCS